MRRNRELDRNSRRGRSESPRLLIFTEDKYAGRSYFLGLKNQLRARGIDLGAEHGEPLNLVRSAVAKRDLAKRDPHTRYDEVWCVIDVEAPVPHPSLEDALTLARQQRVSVAIANPCFELWLYQHFEQVNGYRTSKHMAKALEELGRCNGYCVGHKDIQYSDFAPLVPKAVEHATALHSCVEANRHTNPWTDIHLLVQRIRAEHGCG
ncbi:hypothetical protein GCM10011591_18000 [Nocardia camponoti]|uniref:RloB domain-containing protein n=1 Tax=Nocardia camponoti TaxID=1616106 RepID=A0A917V6U0_9NOCA|nr:hypothetical protein GCM10011591_18000 [Nocardia camponoti]